MDYAVKYNKENGFGKTIILIQTFKTKQKAVDFQSKNGGVLGKSKKGTGRNKGISSFEKL